MVVAGNYEGIVHLVEYASWLNDKYHKVEADLYLHLQRAWDPATAQDEGEGHLSEAESEPDTDDNENNIVFQKTKWKDYRAACGEQKEVDLDSSPFETGGLFAVTIRC